MSVTGQLAYSRPRVCPYVFGQIAYTQIPGIWTNSPQVICPYQVIIRHGFITITNYAAYRYIYSSSLICWEPIKTYNSLFLTECLELKWVPLMYRMHMPYHSA